MLAHKTALKVWYETKNNNVIVPYLREKIKMGENMKRKKIIVRRYDNEISSIHLPQCEQRIREQLKLCRSAGMSDEAVLTRMNNYNRRFNRANKHPHPNEAEYRETCYIMREVYRRIAEERGLDV